MVRSRSRSPRWKRRSLSPTFRSKEHNRERHKHTNYDCEYKGVWKDLRKPVPWRTEDGKHGQNSSRYIPHETNHHQLYECRSYSPTLKRIPSDDIHTHKPCRTHSPERNENVRRYPFPSRYSEMSHKEHSHSFYPSKPHDREIHEDARTTGSTKGPMTSPRSLGSSCEFERKWNDSDFRQHQLQEDKYTDSHRRFSDEFISRSSLQKRYPGDREYGEYGHTSKRAKEMTRYDGREIGGNSQWKQNHTSVLNQEKGDPRNLVHQTYWPVKKEYSDTCQTKTTYDYNQKRHKHPNGGKNITDEKEEKYIKLEDKKYNYPKGAQNNMHSGYNKRMSHVEKPHSEGSVKYSSGKSCSSCTKPCKSEADLVSFNQKEKKRLKKEMDFRGKVDFSSSCQQDTHSKASDVKVSEVNSRKEKLTVKVDVKKTVNKYRGASNHIMERQTSCDLVAVGRKNEKFHPVFEHIKSMTQKVEQNPSKEFAQEIITIIHQVKANCFKSSDLTLHERFSKIQDRPLANDVKRQSDPEIHRRIDMSLAELQNKRAVPSESEQSFMRVLEDPNDLRHDIERRRKERLQNEDENTFYSDGVSQRREQNCNFAKLRDTRLYGFQKPSRFLRPPFRKFTGKFHMNHYYTAESHNRFEGNAEHTNKFWRPFKPHFSESRPHFNSNLVQKGLYIQAKYQRLRYAGARGFTTYKFRGGFLRKNRGLEI